jgi:hypothetical protein
LHEAERCQSLRIIWLLSSPWRQNTNSFAKPRRHILRYTSIRLVNPTHSYRRLMKRWCNSFAQLQKYILICTSQPQAINPSSLQNTTALPNCAIIASWSLDSDPLVNDFSQSQTAGSSECLCFAIYGSTYIMYAQIKTRLTYDLKNCFNASSPYSRCFSILSEISSNGTSRLRNNSVRAPEASDNTPAGRSRGRYICAGWPPYTIPYLRAHVQSCFLFWHC